MLLFFAKERPEALALLENTNSILADLLFILQDSMSLSFYLYITRVFGFSLLVIFPINAGSSPRSLSLFNKLLVSFGLTTRIIPIPQLNVFSISDSSIFPVF